jgi:hypothetical protein
MGYSYGHFEEITGMQWLNQNTKKRHDSSW